MVDRSAWLSQLYEAHSQAVFKQCRRFLANAEDAADASHEVFLKAISSLAADPGSNQARSWLLTVAQHHCLDLIRRRVRLQSALDHLGREAPERESEAEIVNRQLLHSVLARLGDRDRDALWQSAVEERPLAEIAGRLGLSYAAAGQLVHRARKRAWVAAGKLGAALGVPALIRLLRRRSASWSIGQLAAAVVLVPLVGAAVVVGAAANHWRLPFAAPVAHVSAPRPHHSPASGASPGASAAALSQSALADDTTGHHPVRRLAGALRNSTQSVIQAVKSLLPSPPVPAPTTGLQSTVPVPPLPVPTPSGLP